MRTSRLVPLALAVSLLAWSGLLLAEGADDTGSSTPRRHAPKRRPPKKTPRKKAGKKPNRAPDAGAAAAAPSLADASSTLVRDAGVDAGSREDEEDDEDEEERAPSAAADTGAAARARKRAADGGCDAGPEADAGDDDDDDEDEDDEDADEDTAYELGAELATESRLVWRGLSESRGAVLQTSGWAGLYGLSIEGWASYLLNTEGPFDPMTVAGADLTGSYTLTLGDLRIRPGFTLLYFPEGLSTTTTGEASLGASYRLGEFRIVSGTNIDVVHEPGAYFGTLGLTWGRAKPPWTIKGIADIGWATGKYNFEYLGKDVAAFDVIHAGVSARYDLGDVLYFELHVDASTLVAPTLSGTFQEPTLIVGGAALGLDWSASR